MNPLPRIDVIIPFFQRQSGVLSRALASIAAQPYPLTQLRVIVIDDGSPVPARQELVAHPAPTGLRVDVIEQANAGPNEARNTALAHVDPQAECIAYLDSDDTWTGEHLPRAVHALRHSQATAYFANLYHLGDEIDEFTKARRVDPQAHPMLGSDPTLRLYQGDMVHQIATANIIFMPSLVIRADALGAARFPPAHRHGGGDYLYWMDLIAHGARFAFSTVPEVRCGAGINMWYGSGWGTDGLAMRIVDEARFRRRVLTTYAQQDATRDALRQRLAELQSGMVQDIVHRLRRRKPLNRQAIATFFRENPPGWALLRQLGRQIRTTFS